MAKKPAPKKKAKPASSKPSAKPAKKVTKPAVKETKKSATAKTPTKAPVAKAAAKEKEVVEKKPAAKQPTIVSMLEADSSSEDSPKAEKVSKIKPVKIERGNLADEKAKWGELNKKYGKEKAVNYKMSDTFQTMIPLQHKVLGWGFILTNENDRLEVLFETGIRMLISNYKA